MMVITIMTNCSTVQGISKQIDDFYKRVKFNLNNWVGKSFACKRGPIIYNVNTLPKRSTNLKRIANENSHF